MKSKLTGIAIVVFKVCLSIVYALLKLLPVNKNKVLFCSRQTSSVSLDFALIQDEILRRKPDARIVNICCFITGGVGSYLRFSWATLKSMYHLATCRVCILDSYWPVVSILHHKSALNVIQIWHAVGKIKKSGYASVGARSGRSESTARLLNMHGNYDYIIAGGKAWNKFYCESFNTKEDKLLNYGLPRLDYLIDTEETNRHRFFEENPRLEGKTIVLYAPTFRRNMETKWGEIIRLVEIENVALIIKGHPTQKIRGVEASDKIFYFENWKTMDLLAVCDCIVTDYSAIAVEAATIDKPTYYWVYDYDEYVGSNGLNIDLYREMSPYVYKDIDELARTIESGNYDKAPLKEYRRKYLPEDLGSSTAKIVDLAMSILK